MVSGIVALMLQADSSLNPAEVKSILYETALQDVHTGVLPVGGNNTWGNGKVNAYKALLHTLGIQSIGGNDNSAQNFLLYPNPGNNLIHLHAIFIEAEFVRISISNLNGQNFLQERRKMEPGLNKTSLNVENLAPGIYLINVEIKSGNLQFKWVKI
jgi:hypothetical protein